MDLSTDLLVFVVVLALRLLVPLAIPRFPLPAVIAALVIDAVDQTVFQTITDLDLSSYQSYDKALDIYYLTIAYLATMRNWTNTTAFVVSRFLIYYRLVGVVLFELTNERYLLLVFPNTFEYFFIFYEAIRPRWDPRRMSPRLVYGAAAVIWIVIKLPQEYWIHVAQLDFTEELEARPGLGTVLAVLLVALLVAAWWVVTRKLPPADRAFSFDADADPNRPTDDSATRRLAKAASIVSQRQVEKIALISLVCIIFSNILPDVDATGVQIALGVAVLIFSNAAVSEALLRRGVGWETALRQFVAMAAINLALAIGFWLLLPIGDGDIHVGNTLFFLLLLTLLVTLFDRYQPLYAARSQAEPDQAGG